MSGLTGLARGEERSREAPENRAAHMVTQKDMVDHVAAATGFDLLPFSHTEQYWSELEQEIRAEKYRQEDKQQQYRLLRAL